MPVEGAGSCGALSEYQRNLESELVFEVTIDNRDCFEQLGVSIYLHRSTHVPYSTFPLAISIIVYLAERRDQKPYPGTSLDSIPAAKASRGRDLCMTRT